MKLQHNLGGLENLGPVTFEKRVFVAPWERRIFGIHTAMMALGIWTWSDLRKAAEAMNPFDYFKYRYYEKWLGGISAFLVRHGYVRGEELDRRTDTFLQARDGPLPDRIVPRINERVLAYLRGGDSPKRDVERRATFRAGQSVVVKNVPPVDHTRLPGYLRGKQGIVDLVYEGNYTYLCATGPDGLGEAQPVYCVRFDPKEIWGALAEDNTWVYADLYEAYLDRPA